METIKEVFKKYEHLDYMIPDADRDDIPSFAMFILADLWQAVKEHLEAGCYQIGDYVIDENGRRGQVGVMYPGDEFVFVVNKNPRKSP